MTGAGWTARRAEIVPAAARPDLAIHELDGEALVADPLSGDTFHLNRTARLVLRACDGRRTTRAIAAELEALYDVELDRALDDVEELVQWLAESRLLGAAR